MPVIYLQHSQACMNHSGCLQWSDNEFMAQVSKHPSEIERCATKAALMLNYASIKASDNVQKMKVQK
jgi:hypothetical protein